MRIGFDFDDVLLNFQDPLIAYFNKYYNTNYTREHTTASAAEIWKCGPEGEKDRIFEFYQLPEHWNAKPVNGSEEGIKMLSQNHNLHIVTSRTDELREGTEAWLDRHFPQMFDDVHFTNQYYGNGIKRTKGEVCRELGIEVFVDDMLHHAQNVASIGIPVLLLDKPWNQADIEPPVRRVHSWDEIVQILSVQDQHKYQAPTFSYSQEHKNVL